MAGDNCLTYSTTMKVKEGIKKEGNVLLIWRVSQYKI